MGKVQEKMLKVTACLFCKKVGHVKQDCIKYQKWLIKMGMSHAYVCSETNLVLVSPHTWWIDTNMIIHICNSFQNFQTQRWPSQAEDTYIWAMEIKLQLKLLEFVDLD